MPMTSSSGLAISSSRWTVPTPTRYSACRMVLLIPNDSSWFFQYKQNKSFDIGKRFAVFVVSKKSYYVEKQQIASEIYCLTLSIP